MTYALIIVAWINGSLAINTELRFQSKELCEEAKKATTQHQPDLGVPRMVSDCILTKGYLP